MNRKFILSAIAVGVLVAVLCTTPSYAEEGSWWGNKDFERTIVVYAIDAVPSGENGDGSWYLVYGIDPKTKKEKMVEIQLNAWSVISNFNNMKVNRDYPYMMLRDPANYGGIATFKCNGWSDWESLEQYPLCYQLLKFEKPKKIYHGDLKWFSTDQLKGELTRLQAELDSRK